MDVILKFQIKYCSVLVLLSYKSVEEITLQLYPFYHGTQNLGYYTYVETKFLFLD